MKQFLVMVTCGVSLIANAADNKTATVVVTQQTVVPVSYRCSFRDTTCFESRKPVTRKLRRLM